MRLDLSTQVVPVTVILTRQDALLLLGDLCCVIQEGDWTEEELIRYGLTADLTGKMEDALSTLQQVLASVQ